VSKKWKILIPVLVVGVLLMSLGIGLVFAQESTPPAPTSPPSIAYGYCPGHAQWCQQQCQPQCQGPGYCNCSPDNACQSGCNWAQGTATCPQAGNCYGKYNCLQNSNNYPRCGGGCIR